MIGSGQPVDLYKLFMVVKEKGGYDAVCKNRLWDLVGEEYGLGVKVGSSVELVYSKYLSTLETCLKNVADSEFTECNLSDDRVKFGKRLMEVQAGFLLDDYGEEEVGGEIKSVYDYPGGRKLCGTNRVKGMNPELNGAELERVYEYLDGRKLCGTDKVKGENPGCNGAKLDKVYDYQDGRTLCGTNRVKGVNLESNGAKKVWNGGLVDLHMQDHRTDEPGLRKLCNHNAAMEIMEEFDGGKILAVDVSDAVNNMPGLSDGGERCNNDDGDDDDDVLILDPSSVNRESCGRKRKRESMSEMLSWVSSIAKNPCDPVVGSMPEKSKWKSYSNQETWKQALLFREALFLKKDFESSSEKLSWLGQRIHPSMYDDHLGATYNLRQRFRCDKRLLFGKSACDGVFSDSPGGSQGGLERTPSPYSEDCATVHIPLGPTHQAEVPEWTGMAYESDSKWLGIQIWPPLETLNSKLFERDCIGKGRQDSCGCQVQGSVECVRFHIAEKRARVKLELGMAFYQWNFDKVGEEVSRFWTQQEEKKFKDVVKSNPSSSDRCFWDHIFKTFPMKSRENLVSYYFNVYLLQRRGYQNRHTQDNIDSDDEESEFIPLRSVFGHQTHKSRSITLLSPKKPQTKGR